MNLHTINELAARFGLKARARVTLQAVAALCDEGPARLTIMQIGFVAGQSQRTTQAALHELERAGIITLDGTNEWKHPPRYTLADPAKLAPPCPPPPRDDMIPPCSAPGSPSSSSQRSPSRVVPNRRPKVPTQASR